MLKFVIVAFIFTSNGVLCQNRGVLKVAEIVNSVNEKDVPWKADGYGYNEIDVNNFVNSRLGLKIDQRNNLEYLKESTETPPIDDGDDDLPEHYDARERYKNCQIGHIRDQANCGSCWAVSATSALSDRFCIHSNASIKIKLSAHHVMSCQKENNGCGGGYMELVWYFFYRNGTVTGGDYESDEGCQPYQIRPCGYPKKWPCAYPMAYTPRCRNTTCSNEWYDYKKEQKLYKIKKYYSINGLIKESVIRREIYENGPITAGFSVYNDFVFYKKGIYIHTWDKISRFLGGHAVRVIGWGIENDIKYWLVANSWGTEWGEDGFFRIIRGENEVQFESLMHAGIPIV